jgi:hypothetical protein
LLVIDQFEEIVTTHPGRWRERAAFFASPDEWIQPERIRKAQIFSDRTLRTAHGRDVF